MLIAYVKRGMKAGVCAGLVFGLLIALVANPLVAFADEFGPTHAEAHSGNAPSGQHDSVVSMTVTNGVSIIGGVLWGVLLGVVVFGIVEYFLEPAVPGTGGTQSYLLAVAGFITSSGAPWLILPPQPPGVEHGLPTETRLVLYGGMMITGALSCLLSGFTYQRVQIAHGRVTATILALVPFGLLAIPVALSPVNSAESSLPPELATGVTGVIVFGQALLWLLLAGVHARLRRSTRRRPAEGAHTTAVSD